MYNIMNSNINSLISQQLGKTKKLHCISSTLKSLSYLCRITAVFTSVMQGSLVADVNGIIYSIVWILQNNTMSMRLIHMITFSSILFLLTNIQNSIMWKDIYSWPLMISRRLGNQKYGHKDLLHVLWWIWEIFGSCRSDIQKIVVHHTIFQCKIKITQLLLGVKCGRQIPDFSSPDLPLSWVLCLSLTSLSMQETLFEDRWVAHLRTLNAHMRF